MLSLKIQEHLQAGQYELVEQMARVQLDKDQTWKNTCTR